MKSKRIFFIFLALFLITQIVSGAENEYGIVKAWFNEKSATVEGFSMKIGEPGNVKVTIKSNISGHVFVEITEPGMTKGFDVLDGPSKQGERLDNLNIESGWSKTFTWTVSPNGAWKNGNAPLNIFVQFSKIENGKLKGDKKIQFTIANPFILDEQFTGAVSTPKSTPSTTVITSPTLAKAAPFPPILFAVSVLLLAWRWRR